MNRQKKLIVILRVFALLFIISGLGSQQLLASNGQNDSTAYCIIKDDLGREVQVPLHPKRILALNSSMMGLLFNLGVVPVGKVKEYVISRPEAENLPCISYENSPNIEMINKLAPDLIFAQARNHGGLMDSLEATGAAVVFIDPSLALDQVVGRINLLGEVLNCQEKAAAYEKQIKRRAALLREKVKASPIKTALYIQGGVQGVRAARSFCFWGGLLTYLGIENIVPDDLPTNSKAGFITFDIETVIQKDPDAIFVLQPGFKSNTSLGMDNGNNKQNKGARVKVEQSPGSMSPQELLAMYQNDPMWQNMSAVKNGHIYIIPGNVSPGKINVIDAMGIMARLIVPEI